MEYDRFRQTANALFYMCHVRKLKLVGIRWAANDCQLILLGSPQQHNKWFISIITAATVATIFHVSLLAAIVVNPMYSINIH